MTERALPLIAITVGDPAGIVPSVKLGLPFVQTSVDQGTTYNGAGRGLADPRSMAEAIRLAARLDSDQRLALAPLAGDLGGPSRSAPATVGHPR